MGAKKKASVAEGRAIEEERHSAEGRGTRLYSGKHGEKGTDGEVPEAWEERGEKGDF